jgi:tetratricopeptide (TPR) repeat protein
VEGALKDYNEAIRLQPDHAAAFYNRGFAYDNKGDLNGAIENYSEAIRLKPDYAGALNNRGLALYYKGDVEGAPKDCNEAIRLQPEYAFAFHNRGLARKPKATWRVRSRIATRPSASSPTRRPSMLGVRCSMQEAI